jgi:hypothetical protein
VVAFPPEIEEGGRAICKPRRWGDVPPPRYGRGEIPNLAQILDDAGFAPPERIDATLPADKSVCLCLGPDDGPSFWQPLPASGHVTLKLHHGSMPSNKFAMGTQTLPPGGRLGPRAFLPAKASTSCPSAAGRAMINQEWRRIAPETLIYVARGMPHDIHNDGASYLLYVWVVTPPGLDRLFGRVGRPREPGAGAPSSFDAPSNAAELYRRAGLIRLDPTLPSAYGVPSRFETDL